MQSVCPYKIILYFVIHFGKKKTSKANLSEERVYNSVKLDQTEFMIMNMMKIGKSSF